MDEIRSRIESPEFRRKLMPAEAAAALVRPGMTVAVSGFSKVGYPKAVPLALRQTWPGGEGLRIFSGGAVGEEIEGLGAIGAIAQRLPFQASETMRAASDAGRVGYVDQNVGRTGEWVRMGQFGRVDLAIVEASAITRAGLVLGLTVACTPSYVQAAERVIVELNVQSPADLAGLHDLYLPEPFGSRRPIPISSAADRIGSPYLALDADKVAAVVVSEIADQHYAFKPSEPAARIAQLLTDFLLSEQKAGRLPPGFSLQVGVGSLGNALLGSLGAATTEPLSLYSEVLQDSALQLIDEGRIAVASAATLALSDDGAAAFATAPASLRQRIVLRPQEISNHPEVIRRLGVVAVNSGLEADIYGHVNSTAIGGRRVMSGVGGSGDFAQNAWLSIFAMPSVRKGGLLSSIVPFAAHVDHTEHDVHVLVTEQGLADLRGLSPRKRARAIIESCAHPDYKAALRDYVVRAERRGGTWPHVLEDALSWHERADAAGNMMELSENKQDH